MAVVGLASSAASWHAAFSAPISEPVTISREAVLDMLKASNNTVGKNFVLVDLRRTDHEGGFIRGSINLPAQTLYPAIPTLYVLFKAAGLYTVIWYGGSSKGRDTRAARWFTDYIAKQEDEEMRSLVLLEGVKGWATAGANFVQWMDEYDAAVWAQV